MTRTRWHRVKALFAEARPLDAGACRLLLDSSCAEDAELRRDVESLLRSDRDVGSFLAPPEHDQIVSATDDGHRLTPGTRIGRYEIVRDLGAGGMAHVFLARRADDVFEKRVALKLVRQSIATEHARERFRFERQTLATLEHPNITRLLDGGTTPDGLPYLVMEHVQGETIIEYASTHALPVEARLQLFVQACAAVEHAHQRLIVHRDLKPDNMLVTAAGDVKLLDFGIAALLDHEVSSDFTEHATRRPLTPEYASPEQINGGPITTSSDVFSLGVILHELLTGDRPAALDMASSVIGRDVPTGDLDAILVMALRANPAERYASVEQLAADIRRSLRAEPVVARRQTFAYRTERLFRRKQPLMVGALIATITMVVALITTSIGFVQAREGQRAAETAKRDAEEVSSFFEEALVQANPYRHGHTVSVLDLMRESEAAIPTKLSGRPAVETGVRMAMARSYASLMMWSETVPHLEKALTNLRVASSDRPDDELQLAACLSLLGRAYTHVRHPGAIALQREGLAIRQRLLGADHPLIADSIGNLGFALWSSNASNRRWEAAERHYLDAIAMCDRLGLAESRDAARFTMSLAFMESARGRDEEARRRCRAALELYEQLPVTEDLYEQTTRSLYGRLLAQDDRLGEAILQFEAYRDELPDDFDLHKRRNVILRIASLHARQNDHEQALRELCESLAIECELANADESASSLVEAIGRLRNDDPADEIVFAVERLVEARPGSPLQSVHYLAMATDMLRDAGDTEGASRLSDLQQRLESDYGPGETAPAPIRAAPLR